MREAGISRQIVLVGLLDKFEIWDQARFDALPMEDVSEELFGLRNTIIFIRMPAKKSPEFWNNAYTCIIDLKKFLQLLHPRKMAFILMEPWGWAGHAKAILDAARTASFARWTGFFCSWICKNNLAQYGERVSFFNMEYSQFEEALQQLGWAKVDGAFPDLGGFFLSAWYSAKRVQF